MEKLETFHSSNDGDFWNLLKQMKNSNFEKQLNYDALSPIQDLNKHYKELLQKKHNPTIKQPNQSKNFDSLNGDIAIKEIKQTIKKLKNKNALGNDSVMNEMVKCSDKLMLVKLEKLFNKIFMTGYYPNSWNKGLIFSIYRSSEKENLNNLRGITSSNSLGKLFNTISYNRIKDSLPSSKPQIFYLQHNLDFVRTIERQIISSLFLAL